MFQDASCHCSESRKGYCFLIGQSRTHLTVRASSGWSMLILVTMATLVGLERPRELVLFSMKKIHIETTVIDFFCASLFERLESDDMPHKSVLYWLMGHIIYVFIYISIKTLLSPCIVIIRFSAKTTLKCNSLTQGKIQCLASNN